MVLRPQGLFPERRRSLELTEAIAGADVDEGMLEEVDERGRRHRARRRRRRTARR